MLREGGSRWLLPRRRVRQWAVVAGCLLAASLYAPRRSHGSIYPIYEREIAETTFTEGNMFATDHGPFQSLGDSTIEVNLVGSAPSAGQEAVNDFKVVTTFYHVDDRESLERNKDKLSYGAFCASGSEVEVHGLDELESAETKFTDDSTISVHQRYLVKKAGLHFVQISTCSSTNLVKRLQYDGTITFKNPHGYLPAAFYGLYPYSGFLALCYGFASTTFAVLLLIHREKCMRLQYYIFIVLITSVVVWVSWFHTWDSVNKNGNPICCPYATPYLLSVLLETVSKTMNRVLLLVVCLGYGVTRLRLEQQEVVLVSLLSVIYQVSTVIDEIEHGESEDKFVKLYSSYWTLLSLICDITFIVWIYLALYETMAKLRATKQTYKLQMYEHLLSTISTFLTLTATLGVIVLASHVGVFNWPWNWAWVHSRGIWWFLNLSVILGISYIWRPTATSSRYAVSSEVPSCSDDETAAINQDTSNDSLECKNRPKCPVPMANVCDGDLDDVIHRRTPKRESDDDDDGGTSTSSPHAVQPSPSVRSITSPPRATSPTTQSL